MPGPAYQVLHSVHSFGEDLSIARTNPLKSRFLQGEHSSGAGSSQLAGRALSTVVRVQVCASEQPEPFSINVPLPFPRPGHLRTYRVSRSIVNFGG